MRLFQFYHHSPKNKKGRLPMEPTHINLAPSLINFCRYFALIDAVQTIRHIKAKTPSFPESPLRLDLSFFDLIP